MATNRFLQRLIEVEIRRTESELLANVTDQEIKWLEWWLEMCIELSADVQAHEVLRQVFPDMPAFSLESWRPSTPAPGMTLEEFELRWEAP